MKVNLLPADTYIVKNNTILDSENRNIFFKLYQPIIGAPSINLYLTLWSDLDSLSIISTEYNHHSLMAKTRLKLDDLLEAREKLEAIGLLKTYVKKGTINTYIYELYSPLEPQEFFDNPILNETLYSNIGKNEYSKTKEFFTIPEINLKEYEEITAPFTETFDVINSTNVQSINNIRKVNQIDFVVSNKLDLNKVLSDIPEEYLNIKTITNKTKDLIYKLSFIYNLDEEEISTLIRNSINEKRMIDSKKLRENCQNYYTFENTDSAPSLVYKKQPQYLRNQTSDGSKRAKLIYTFETTSPYDYLTGKNKGVKPNKTELMILETLLIDYNLLPGVVNVLIDYVLKINNNKLTKNFIMTIATQWKRSNIKTVEEAMEICKKEVKQKPKKKQKKEIKPKWYNQNISENIASEEEIKELENLLKR